MGILTNYVNTLHAIISFTYQNRVQNREHQQQTQEEQDEATTGLNRWQVGLPLPTASIKITDDKVHAFEEQEAF